MPQADYLLAVSAYGEHDIRLINRMKEKGNKILIVPRNKFVLRQYQGNLSDDYILAGHLDHTPTKSLSELAEKYDIRSQRSFVFPEMVYDHAYPSQTYNRYISPNYGKPDYGMYLKRLHCLLDYFDDLYSAGFDGVHITNQGAKIFRQVLQIVADYHDKQSIRYSFNPLPGRKSVRHSTGMNFPELNHSMNTHLTPSEKSRADEYINSLKKEKSVYTPQPKGSSSNIDELKYIINNAKAYEGNLLTAAGSKLSRRLLKSIGKTIQSQLYENSQATNELINSKDYIFYPIQYSIESRVTLRAPEFYEQDNIIKYISRNLPNNSEQFIVKDHPHHIGHLSLNAAYEISQNSCFIDPTISAHRLIQNSDAVITLNNTVGHEAIVWQKPVITLGDALYSDIGLTYDVEDIGNISDVVERAIEQGGPSKKEVRRYVNGLFKISDEINWKSTSEKSIDDTVSSIMKRTL